VRATFAAPLSTGKVPPMPRYYFHVRRGQMTVLDQVGSELPDLVEAAKEAARRSLQIEAIGSLKDIENNGVIIVDDEFSTVLEVPFGGSLVTFQSQFRQAPRRP
jgi:hypothetical protein